MKYPAVFLDRDGTINEEVGYLNDLSRLKLLPGVGEALKLLKDKLSDVSKEQTVVLRSDKESKFQDFVTVMDILKHLNHEQLYIVTKE